MDMTLVALARQFANAFQEVPRPDGGTMVRVRARSPEWVKVVVREAHQQGAMLPDDTRYRFLMALAPKIAEALEASDATEPQDLDLESEVDVYTSQLLAWLASHPERLGYVDQVLHEMGGLPRQMGLEDVIRQAQYLELEEVARGICDGLRKVVANAPQLRAVS